jgi:hypothetical protein
VIGLGVRQQAGLVLRAESAGELGALVPSPAARNFVSQPVSMCNKPTQLRLLLCGAGV